MMQAPMVPQVNPQAKAQYEAQLKRMQAMQQQQQAQMQIARKAYEERMKQWAVPAPIAK
jgi:hypothetical protein